MPKATIWHRLAQFDSIWHPVHWWAQNQLVWHIIEVHTWILLLMHKIVFCCIVEVDLAQYGTSINHPGVSEYMTKLQNAAGKQNKNSKLTLYIWKFFTLWKKIRIKYLLCFLHTTYVCCRSWQPGNDNLAMATAMIWHNSTQFDSIWHPVHWWAQNGLVCHIIETAYLNPITHAQNCVLLHHLGGFSTIWHFNKSSWGKYITKLQNAAGKQNENSKLTLYV